MLDAQNTIDTLLDWIRNHHFGKYRGIVVNTSDPTNRGRLQVRVPEVLGPNTVVWALPCVPYAGNGVGFKFLPPVDTNVWVEFEKGDVSYPVWTGFFWAEGEMPSAAEDGDNVKVLQTSEVTIRIDDQAGEIRIESTNGATITLTDGITAEAGATVSIGSSAITLDAGGTVEVGAVTVDINSGHLTVE